MITPCCIPISQSPLISKLQSIRISQRTALPLSGGPGTNTRHYRQASPRNNTQPNQEHRQAVFAATNKNTRQVATHSPSSTIPVMVLPPFANLPSAAVCLWRCHIQRSSSISSATCASQRPCLTNAYRQYGLTEV